MMQRTELESPGHHNGLYPSRTAPYRLTLLVMAFALLAAACSSSSNEGVVGAEDPTPTAETQVDETADPDADADADTDAGADPTPTPEPSEEPPAPLTASWTGVTEDTIRLGFTTTDLDQLREMGLVDLDRGDPQLVLDALVADVNAQGGINGRMIDAHLEIVLPIGAANAEAACVVFTQDIGVFAVLSPFAGPNTEVNPCINSLNATVIVGGQPTAAQLEISEAPWISQAMFSDRRLAAVVELMEDADLLGDTVGLVVTAEERAAADDIVIPALEALGKNVVLAELVVASGDAVAANAAYEIFVERFRTENVESVVLVENTATFGASALKALGFEPQILVVDSAQLLAGLGNRDQVPLEDLAGIVGSGGASAEEEWELAATQDCIRAFEEANPDIEVVPTAELAEDEPDWLGNIRIFCTPLRLFQLVAEAAGAELTHDSFLQAAEGLGEVDLPFTPFASLAPGKLDAADAVRLTVFDPSVPPSGAAVPFGPLVATG